MGVRVGVSVLVGVNVLVHEVAVFVAASEVIVATCSTFGLQAARVSKGMTRISLNLII